MSVNEVTWHPFDPASSQELISKLLTVDKILVRMRQRSPSFFSELTPWRDSISGPVTTLPDAIPLDHAAKDKDSIFLSLYFFALGDGGGG
jgi:hypothetical protein